MKLQITVDGNTYEVEVEVLEEDQGALQSSYTHPSPPPIVPGALSYGQIDGEDLADKKACHSPVTGLVIKVNVQPGQHVQPNHLMMVLEAMKMETNLMAPCAATVKTVTVAPGDSVKLNQVVIEFE